VVVILVFGSLKNDCLGHDLQVSFQFHELHHAKVWVWLHVVVLVTDGFKWKRRSATLTWRCARTVFVSCRGYVLSGLPFFSTRALPLMGLQFFWI